MIEPDGAVVLFDEEHPGVPENDWHRDYGELLEGYAADDPVRSQRKAPGWLRHEAILLDSAFARLQRYCVIERRRTPTERLVDRAFSQSSTSRARLGPRADRLVEEIRELLGRIAPGGSVTEVVESVAMIARRPRSRSRDRVEPTGEARDDRQGRRVVEHSGP